MRFIKSLKTKALAVFTVLCMLAGSAGVYVNAETGYAVKITCQSYTGTGGEVQYRTSESESFSSVAVVDGRYTTINLDNTVSSITIKLKANEGYTIDRGRGIKLTHDNSVVLNTAGDNPKVSIDAFTFNDGYTIDLSQYSNSTSKEFELEFGFVKIPTYSVDFGNGSWIIDNTTVTASLSGTQTIKDSDVITLTNFNSSTMEAILTEVTENNTYVPFTTVLAVDQNGNTTLANQKADHLPTNLSFQVQKSAENPPGGNPPEENRHAGYENGESVTSALSLNGNIDFFVNDSKMVNYPDPVGDNYVPENIEYKYFKDVESPTVDFYVQNFINERYTSIKINGTDYIEQLPKPYTEEGRTAMVDACIGQVYEYKITVPYAESYVISATKEDIAADSPYWAVGNFLWSYSETDDQGHPVPEDQVIGNGKLTWLSVTYKGKTYYATDSELPSWLMWDPGTEGRMGSAVLPAGAIVTAKVIPDYGYQVLNLEGNGSKLSPTENISEFTFEVYPGNFHLGAKFVETDNVVNSTSDIVKDGSVTLNGPVIEEGTVIVDVKDDNADVQDFENEIPDYMSGYYVNGVVDISMNQVWYKGTDEDYWANEITEMKNGSATVTLAAPTGYSDIQVIHEKHDGSYEMLGGTNYNPEKGELSFTTDSFSRFALVYKDADEIVPGLHINVVWDDPSLGEIYMDGKKISFNNDYENVYGKHTFRIVSPTEYKGIKPGVVLYSDDWNEVELVELTEVNGGYEFTLDLNEEKSENWFLDITWNEFDFAFPKDNELMIWMFADGADSVLVNLSGVEVKKALYSDTQVKYFIERTENEQKAKLSVNTNEGKILTFAEVEGVAYGEPQAEGEITKKLIGSYGHYEFDLTIDPIGDEYRNVIFATFNFEDEKEHTFDESGRCTGCGKTEEKELVIGSDVSKDVQKIILGSQNKINVSMSVENIKLPVIDSVKSVDILVSKKVEDVNFTSDMKSITYDITPVVKITQENGTVSYVDINTVLKQNPGMKAAVTLPLNGMNVKEVVHISEEYGTSYLHDEALIVDKLNDTTTVYVDHFSSFKLNEKIEDPSYKGKPVVDTSDHSQNVLWMSLMLVSAVAAVGIIRFRRRCN